VIFLEGASVVGFGEPSCPSNPPPPAGYVIWKGPVPAPLVQWAVDLRDRIRQFPRGYTWTIEYGGQPVLARHDSHTWTWKNGVLVTGLCLSGITLYKPSVESPGGLSEAEATDPALATPDPSLALYSISATQPPERTDWGLVTVCAAALATVAGGFVWGLREAGR
jgi:hypothetical protein